MSTKDFLGRVPSAVFLSSFSHDVISYTHLNYILRNIFFLINSLYFKLLSLLYHHKNYSLQGMSTCVRLKCIFCNCMELTQLNSTLIFQSAMIIIITLYIFFACTRYVMKNFNFSSHDAYFAVLLYLSRIKLIESNWEWLHDLFYK